MNIPAALPGSVPSVTTLSTGVTLLNAPLPSRNVGVMLIVRAGSRDETPQTAGLAHFLEHLFFKGTQRRPTTQEITREVDRLGAITNAYTDTEEVAYYAEGPATAMHALADILADMLSRPLFAVEEVERERNVVLQELAARLLRPQGWIGDRLFSVCFGGGQPLSWSAAGFPTVVRTVTREAIVDYHRHFYAPASMALVVTGGATLGSTEAEELLSLVPRASVRSRPTAAWGLGDRYVANLRPRSADEEAQIDLTIGFPGIRATDPDRTVLSVMSFVLGTGMSSRLFHRVREREGLCYRISASHEALDDTGVFALSTATRPEDAARAVRLSVRELRRLGEEAIAEDEFTAAKAAMVGRLLRGTETAGASTHWYGARWRAGLPVETPDQRAAAILDVTTDDVVRVAQRIVAGIGDARCAFVGPHDQGDELLDATVS